MNLHRIVLMPTIGDIPGKDAKLRRVIFWHTGVDKAGNVPQ